MICNPIIARNKPIPAPIPNFKLLGIEFISQARIGVRDIIKNNIFVTFGKGEDDKAKQLLDLAQNNGFEPQQKSDVAWATLTALFRERIESGLDMPSDVFSTWIKDKTKITRK